MDRPPVLMLMGLRASGKSSVARALADDGLDAADLDDDVLQRCNATTVRDVWTTRGEAGFREAEAHALRDRLQSQPRRPLVLALGGGSPTAPGAAEAIRAARTSGHAFVIYLDVPPDVLAERLAPPGQTDDRPSLTGRPAAEEVREVHALRDPLFRALADVVIDASAPLERVVARVRSAWLGQGDDAPK